MPPYPITVPVRPTIENTCEPKSKVGIHQPPRASILYRFVCPSKGPPAKSCINSKRVPRVGDNIVYLGRPDGLRRKLDRLRKFYKYGLSRVGWDRYSYISVEFDNQIICKKRKHAAGQQAIQQ